MITAGTGSQAGAPGARLPEAATGMPPHEPTDPGRDRPVLVVEDDAGLRKLIVMRLRRSGYAAREAPTGTEAIEQVAADPSLLLLLDHQLTDMTGRDVVLALAERDVRPFFVIMTGQGNEQLAVEMMKQGAADYLVKDTDFIDRLPGILERTFRSAETEQRLREAGEALRKSEALYRLFLDGFIGIAYQFEPGTFRPLMFQGMVEEISGYRASDFTTGNVTWPQLVHPEDRSRYNAASRALLANTRRVADTDYRIINRTGTIRWVRDIARLAVDEVTGKQMVQGAVYDISEPKLAEEELKNRKEMLDKVIGAMRDALVVLDSAERIALANPAFTEIAGANRPEGRYLWEVLPDKNLTDLARSPVVMPPATARVLIGGRNFIASASRLASGHVTVMTLSDVTEIERMAEVKRDLAINVSHELRTPLTAIKGFLEILADKASGEDLRYIQVISRNTERLINIVQDLLILSQVEDGPPPDLVPVELDQLVADILPIFERRAHDKGLALKLETEPDLPPVVGDTFALEQVVTNLVDNAIKYTSTGRVLVRLGRADDRVQLEVEDTGIGIPADRLPRLYERFFCVDKARSRRLGGSGLGLAIVKHILLRHNGTVQAESRPGHGSRFIVTLPVAQDARTLQDTGPQS